MIAQELEVSLHMIFVEAKQKRHEFVTVEHLLFALLTNPSAVEVLKTCHADIERLRIQLRHFLDQQIPCIPMTVQEEFDAHPTLGFQRVIQRAILHVQASGKKEVNGANVLMALFSEKDAHAVFFLHQQGITRLDIVNILSHGFSGTATKVSDDLLFAKRTRDETVSPRRTQFDASTVVSVSSPLELYTRNLNEMAEKGKFDPIIARDEELARLVQVLCRRRKNNPLLVGEAGVGKTAIVEGLVRHIVDKKVNPVLQNTRVYWLDMGALLAGTKYRGDFEQRLKSVLHHLCDTPDTILFIDEIHTLIGAGAASGGTLDASNLLKPALSSGQLRCIGATTFTEFRSIFEKDSALSRRFQRIEVREPSTVDSVAIIDGLKSCYESYHGVVYTAEAIQTAVDLSSKYIRDRFLPDKAIDVIDEAGAAYRLSAKEGDTDNTITAKHIESTVAKITKMPAETISVDDRTSLKKLDRDLKVVIFGQDDAIEALVTTIKTVRSGLGQPEKPMASFLFAGPTGVGKTELARQLAYSLGIELVRFDMSEYMESHAVARLIGSPPGYVGFERGGLLTEAVSKKPHCVLLLDELEKAHPDVFNILLQVMDYGTLTDNNGRKVNFRQCIIIMTTNAGAKMRQKNAMGFNSFKSKHDEMDELKKHFSPEFRNRLDSIIFFNNLSRDIIFRIIDKSLMQLEMQLQQKHVEATFGEGLRQYLFKNGFDEEMGARHLSRLVQKTVRAMLADELLFGHLAEGGAVHIDVQNQHVLMAFHNEQKVSKKVPQEYAE